MPTTPFDIGSSATLLGRCIAGWNRFWFTPSDPTTLCLIRVLTGLVTLYTFFAYSLDLSELLGPQGWMDLETRFEMVRNAPIPRGATSWTNTYEPAKVPADAALKSYYDDYVREFHMPPPPPNARSARESEEFIAYKKKWGEDPRLIVAQGRPVWSLWFHITDPQEMAVAQGIILVIAFLFLIGFCTRITAVLTWLAALSYTHRATASLFGVDTMMVILLLYLAIGPSGAVLSVDSLIARWWSKAGPDVIRRWRAFWSQRDQKAILSSPSEQPTPSVSATVAIRLLQIHLCIIYLAAGLAKLQGPSWWNGNAVWGTVANVEFAPLEQGWYVEILRLLVANRVVFEIFFTVAAVFTLTFEISYAFLIWRPWARPILLGMAFILHGFIGMFMSLRTFSMLMVVMNLAFVSPETVNRWLRIGRRLTGEDTKPPAPNLEPVLESTGKPKS